MERNDMNTKGLNNSTPSIIGPKETEVTPSLKTSDSVVTIEVIRQDAKSFPRLHSYGHAEALKNMSGLIVKTYLYLGRKAPNPKDVQFTAQQVLYEIHRDIFGLSLSNITFEEIERAVIKKIIEAPETVYGICVGTFMSAIVNYARTSGSAAANNACEIKAADIRKGINELTNTPMVKDCIEDMVNRSSLGKRSESNHSSPLPFTHETGMPNSPGKSGYMGSGPYTGDSDGGTEASLPESPI